MKITRSISISPAQRVRLALDTLRDFNVPKDMLIAVREHINNVMAAQMNNDTIGNTVEGGSSNDNGITVQ